MDNRTRTTQQASTSGTRWGLKPADKSSAIDTVVGERDVLVKVAAVTVDPIDTYIRSGAYKTPLPLPFIVGRDMTGVVAEIGTAVTRFKPGDRVWANNQGYDGRQGTFAEYVSVDKLPLSKTAEAHRMYETNDLFGKLVLLACQCETDRPLAHMT